MCWKNDHDDRVVLLLGYMVDEAVPDAWEHLKSREQARKEAEGGVHELVSDGGVGSIATEDQHANQICHAQRCCSNQLSLAGSRELPGCLLGSCRGGLCDCLLIVTK